MSVFNGASFQAARRGAFGKDLRGHASLGSTQDAAREALRAGVGAGGCVAGGTSVKGAAERWST